MNRERRRVLGGVFADAAKYTLTVGVIGSLLIGGVALSLGLALVAIFGLLVLFAYFVTPPDTE